MTQPAVNTNELDGALGILPETEGEILVVMGPADSGSINTPVIYARTTDMVTARGGGPTVEAAAYYIERYGRPVGFIRTGASVLGSYLDSVAGQDGTLDSITTTNPGGSATFTDSSSDPVIEGLHTIVFNVGGTRGVAGIVYQIVRDGVYGNPIALGTATSITIGSTGIVIAIGAGTISTGAIVEIETTAPILASAGEVTDNTAGTSTPTIDSSTHPNDDYEVYIEFVTGGTIGVTGITYKYSLDGGRSMSAVQALLTADSIIIPNSGGIKVDFSAGTIIAGDNLAFPTVAPRWNNTELGTALDALKASSINWRDLHIIGPLDPSAKAIIDAKFTSFENSGLFKTWHGNVRMPIGDESEEDYFTSLESAWEDEFTVTGQICAGACDIVSGVSGRKYKRPISHAVVSKQASVKEHINIAAVKKSDGGGPLPGVSIKDANGNPKHHDESTNPGLDDLRFTVLRTFSRRQGVFVNRPRIFSSPGSDFYLVPHRQIMNLMKRVSREFLEERLSKPLRVSKTTGFILETEALEIESGGRARLRDALLADPMASDVSFTVNRNDNVLSTKKIRTQQRAVPLAYPEIIESEVGFTNPALQTTTV